MKRGDHIKVQRTWYWHHAIYVGDGTVIDYSKEGSEDLEPPRVRLRPYRDFATPSDKVEIVKYDDGEPLPTERVIKRAFRRLGERKYSLIGNNCEHFSTWSKTGHGFSWQEVIAGIGTGAAITMVAIKLMKRSHRHVDPANPGLRGRQ